jgi:hypothetical protein
MLLRRLATAALRTIFGRSFRFRLWWFVVTDDRFQRADREDGALLATDSDGNGTEGHEKTPLKDERNGDSAVADGETVSIAGIGGAPQQSHGILTPGIVAPLRQ